MEEKLMLIIDKAVRNEMSAVKVLREMANFLIKRPIYNQYVKSVVFNDKHSIMFDPITEFAVITNLNPDDIYVYVNDFVALADARLEFAYFKSYRDRRVAYYLSLFLDLLKKFEIASVKSILNQETRCFSHSVLSDCMLITSKVDFVGVFNGVNDTSNNNVRNMLNPVNRFMFSNALIKLILTLDCMDVSDEVRLVFKDIQKGAYAYSYVSSNLCNDEYLMYSPTLLYLSHNGIENPLNLFDICEKLKMDIDDFIINNISIDERLHLGLTITRDEYNELVKDTIYSPLVVNHFEMC